MKLRYKIIILIVILLKCLHINQIIAANLSTIIVTNSKNQATVVLNCNAIPVYMIFMLHNPERIVIDLFKIYDFEKNKLPISFDHKNLIKCVRTSTPINLQSMRIVLDLMYASDIEMVTQKKVNKNYCLILKICKKKISSASDANVRNTSADVRLKSHIFNINQIVNDNERNMTNFQYNENIKNKKKKQFSPIVIAVDAGHGGQDPGATGCNGIYEKNITISIAKKLKVLLDADPMFRAVMIRDGDYFLSVMARSDIARKKRANMLISIHADSALNVNVRGASVWVLSNRRAKSEMMSLLQCREKHSELLGGLGDVLTNYCSDPYFNHFILDLQFGYSQRVGYDIAIHVLQQLKGMGLLHKYLPEYSSFGILRAPDIPSILVEVGFISNIKEVYLLSNTRYQEKIAQALYQGLRNYFIVQLKVLSNNYSKIKNVYNVPVS